ncbi:MAG: hypothetical protein GY711_06800 [bacterium]|nr:hypothetical protein [bacterium]
MTISTSLPGRALFALVACGSVALANSAPACALPQERAGQEEVRLADLPAPADITFEQWIALTPQRQNGYMRLHPMSEWAPLMKRMMPLVKEHMRKQAQAALQPGGGGATEGTQQAMQTAKDHHVGLLEQALERGDRRAVEVACDNLYKLTGEDEYQYLRQEQLLQRSVSANYVGAVEAALALAVADPERWTRWVQAKPDAPMSRQLAELLGQVDGANASTLPADFWKLLAEELARPMDSEEKSRRLSKQSDYLVRYALLQEGFPDERLAASRGVAAARKYAAVAGDARAALWAQKLAVRSSRLTGENFPNQAFVPLLRSFPGAAPEVRALFYLCDAWRNSSQLGAMESLARASVREHPTGGGFYALAVVQVRQEKWDSARKSLTRSIEADPASSQPHLLLALVESEGGSPERAREQVLEASRYDLDLVGSWKLFATWLRGSGKTLAGTRALIEATKVAPDDRGLWALRIEWANKDGDLLTLVDALRGSIAAGMNDTEQWTALAEALDELGRSEERDEAYAHGIALDPQAPAPWHSLRTRSLAGLSDHVALASAGAIALRIRSFVPESAAPPCPATMEIAFLEALQGSDGIAVADYIRAFESCGSGVLHKNLTDLSHLIDEARFVSLCDGIMDELPGCDLSSIRDARTRERLREEELNRYAQQSQRLFGGGGGGASRGFSTGALSAYQRANEQVQMEMEEYYSATGGTMAAITGMTWGNR